MTKKQKIKETTKPLRNTLRQVTTQNCKDKARPPFPTSNVNKLKPPY